jgi:hypothetical protein
MMMPQDTSMCSPPADIFLGFQFKPQAHETGLLRRVEHDRMVLHVGAQKALAGRPGAERVEREGVGRKLHGALHIRDVERDIAHAFMPVIGGEPHAWRGIGKDLGVWHFDLLVGGTESALFELK